MTVRRIGEVGRRAERHFARRTGATQVAGSGSGNKVKGDLHLGRFKIEVKSTEAQSLSVKKAVLDKIAAEALSVSREPALQIMFVDRTGRPVEGGSWVCIPEYLFLEKCVCGE